MPISRHSFTNRTKALTLAGLLSLALPASTRAATLQFIHDFKGGTDGANPAYGLVIGPQGAVYGTTATTIFRLAEAKNGKWLEKPIFAPGMASLIGTPTALYGLTQAGFTMLTPPSKGGKAWTQTTLYSFPTGSGAAIPSTLAIAPDGSFAGTSPEGGGATACGSDNGVPTGCGTLFSLTESNGTWSETILHAFQGGKDGALPLAAPSFDSAGNIFVSTLQGGGTPGAPSCSGLGAIGYFVMLDLVFGTLADLSCAQSLLAYPNSQAYPIPASPKSASLRDGKPQPRTILPDSAVIVTTLGGGHATECPDLDDNGCGAIALYTQPANGRTPWKLEILHRFSGPDGAGPSGALTALGTDTLYGIAGTYGGKCTNVGYGFGGCGTIYQLVQGANGWAWGGLLYKFPGGARGTNPVPNLLSYNGMLLGVTTYGGSSACGNPGCGTIFALTP